MGSFRDCWPILREVLAAGLATVAFSKFVDTPAGVNYFLLARVKGVAIRTDLNLEIACQRGAGRKPVPATAGHVNFAVFWMDIRFHGSIAGSRGRVSILPN
jgi:hypothetical protein